MTSIIYQKIHYYCKFFNKHVSYHNNNWNHKEANQNTSNTFYHKKQEFKLTSPYPEICEYDFFLKTALSRQVTILLR